MARRYAGDIPRGDRQLHVAGRASSGAGRLAAVSGPGRVAVSPGRQFAVRAEGSWGLRALSNAFGVFADASRQIMDSEFKVRAKEVEREQSLLGAQYGAGVELDQLQLPAGDSVGDEAFRRSAILASRAKADMAAYDDIEDLAKTLPGQPEEFRKAVGARAQKFVSKLPPEMQPEVLQSYSRLGQQKFLEIDEDRRKFQRDEIRASISSASERYGNQAALLARRGDWAGAKAEIGKLAEMLTAAGPVEVGGSGAMSLQEIEEQAQNAREVIQGQFLKGWVERTNNPRGALAALRNGSGAGGEVDEVLAVTGPRVIDQLAGQLETEIKSREAEARAAARERLQEARWEAGIIVDNEQAAADAGTMADPGWKAKVRAAYGDHAEPVIAAIDHRRDTALAVRDLSTMPTADMAGLIEGRLPEGEGYAYEAKDLATLQTAAGKVLERRTKDPAGEVLRSFPSVAEAFKGGQSGAALKEMARIQVENFGLPPDKVQLLTTQQAADAVGAFKSAVTVDDRMTALQSVTTAIGDDALARSVLSQLEDKGLPAGARFALEAQERGDPEAAREILAGLSVDPKDLPKVAEAKTADIGAAVDTLMAGETQAGLTQRVANMSRQPGLFARAQAERAEMVRLTTQYAAAGDDPKRAASKAERAIYGSGGVAGSEDLGFVRAPEGVDADALTDALEQMRASVDLSHLAPETLPVRPGQAGTGAEQQAADFAARDFVHWAQSIHDNGVWANVDGGFALLDPATGRQVAFKTLAELTAARQAPPLPAAPDAGLVAPGLGGYDGLSGDSRLDTLVNSTGGGINPQLSVLLQRLIGRIPAPTYNPQLTAEQAAALGIPTAPKK